MPEFTFFVDADTYEMSGGHLMAEWADLVEAGVERVDVSTAFGKDLGDRVPVTVVGSATGLRFYARLLHLSDPIQLEELTRVLTVND